MMFNCTGIPGTFEKALSNPKDWIYLSHENLPLHPLQTQQTHFIIIQHCIDCLSFHLSTPN